MDSNQIMMEILANLQKKTTFLNRIMETTKEMQAISGETVSEGAFSGFLERRQAAMDSIDRLDAQNASLLLKLPAALQKKVKGHMLPSARGIVLENPLQANIYETSKYNFSLVKRIIDENSELNAKVKRIHAFSP